MLSTSKHERPASFYDDIMTDPDVEPREPTHVPDCIDWKCEAVRPTSMILAMAIFKRIPLSEALVFLELSAYIGKSTPCSIYADAGLLSRSGKFDDSASVFSRRSCTSSDTSSVRIDDNLYTYFFPYTPSISRSATAQSVPIPLRPLPGLAHSEMLARLKCALESTDLSCCWGDMAGVLLWIALTDGAASRKIDKNILSRYFSALAVRVCVYLCFEHADALQDSLMRMNEIIKALGDKGVRVAAIERRGEKLKAFDNEKCNDARMPRRQPDQHHGTKGNGIFSERDSRTPYPIHSPNFAGIEQEEGESSNKRQKRMELQD